MMRLPQVASARGLNACFIGVPFDLGTSLRSGARFGPRDIRANSVLIRPYLMATRARPFDSLNVATTSGLLLYQLTQRRSAETRA